MSRTWKRFLSLLLVATMVLSLGVTGFAADEDEPAEEPVKEAAGGVEVEFEQVDNDIIASRLPLANEIKEEAEPEYAEDEVVRVSIVLDGPSALEAGYAPASASSYRANLKAEQDALANQISAQALNGAPLDVVHNLTLAANIISANVEYGQIEDIRNVIGVSNVFVENLYLPAEDEVNNGNATVQTNTTLAWDLGYTGAGSRIAIVDTGLDTDHQSFNEGAFLYAIKNLDKDVTLMTEADVAAVWEDLNVKDWVESASDAYLSAKVPFAVNYIDRDLDVTHDNDDEGEHGSHVAGIAAANKYIPNGDGTYSDALETVKTVGQAPDAQLLIMKVFGKGHGAYDSDYFMAVEDALVLGCDSVNLSLGSSVAGFTETPYNAILDSLADKTDLVWTNSAGNNSSWGVNAIGMLYADDIGYHTGGSPATYHNTLSVASVDNTGFSGYYFETAAGTPVYFDDGSGNNNEPFAMMMGTHTYIAIDGYGTPQEFYSLRSVLQGNVAVCSRGSTSFYEKANAAVLYGGASAVIIYNNQPGTISMSLQGYNETAPAVSITAAAGAAMKQEAEQKTLNGATYYEGTLTLAGQIGSENSSPEYMTISDFSSWGGNGALTMKPEITAPGGNIWSVNGAIQGGTAYEVMSGTSMASPQIAGLNAVLKEYIRDTDLSAKLGLPERTIAQSLMMSTAIPLRDANSDGGYYSILAQGAGLADTNAAITARSLVTVTGLPDSAPASAWEAIDDGKVKMELGEVNNGFEGSFNLTNFSDEDISFYLSGDFFTQEISEAYGIDWRWEETVPVYASLAWAVNGTPYQPLDPKYDFNGDGVTNGLDAQFLLDACAKGTAEDIANADLNNDGAINTVDAKLAFEQLNGMALTLAAGETKSIAVAVTFDMSEYDEYNGNYVEGFLFVQEGASDDGALGVLHSIPVYGFNGNITDAAMFDRGSALEYKYGFGDGAEETFVDPYMAYADFGDEAYDFTGFTIKYTGDSNAYIFGGNPLIPDESYMPERNALNNEIGDVIASVRYTLIRNAGASRFVVLDKYGHEITDAGFEDLEDGLYAAYYYANGGYWTNYKTNVKLNYNAPGIKEGDKLSMFYQVAPEYYITYNEQGKATAVDWEDLGDGTLMSTQLVIDNTAPDIVKVERVAADGDNLVVTTHDNQFIAAVAVFNDQGELLDAQGSIADTIRGMQNDYSFDLSKDAFLVADEATGEKSVYPYLLVQVYDYAMNLSTYKLNFVQEITDETPVEGVKVDPSEAHIYGKNKLRLTATVLPWGLADDVTWSSEDEKIAIVDDNGIVIGVNDGVTNIIATSRKDPTKSGVCEVTVTTFPVTLIGALQDEDGTPLAFAWDMKNDITWTPIAQLENSVTATAYDWVEKENYPNGVLYQQDFSGYMHKLDPSTFETLESSAATTASGAPMEDIDIPFIYNMVNETNSAVGVAETYFLISDDIMENTFNDGWNLGTVMSNNTGGTKLVAVAWAGGIYDEEAEDNYDMFLALDDAGYLWEMDLYTSGDLGLDLFGTDLAASYPLVDITTGNSLILGDDGNLYLAHFNGQTSEIYQLGYVGDGMFHAEQIGDVGTDVWPATLFTVLENEEEEHPDGLPGRLVPEGVGDSVAFFAASEMESFGGDSDYVDDPEPAAGPEPIEEPVIEEITEPAEIEEPVETTEPVGDGSLNAVRGQVGTDKTYTEVTLTVTADEATTNGKITIDFDPTTATLVDAIPGLDIQFKGIVDESEELGHYVLAYVTLDPGIAEGETLLTLKFADRSEGTVTIKTDEINDKTGPEEIVILGSTVLPEEHEHVFGEPKWTWNEDYSSAVATFLCEECGAARSVKAEIEAEIVEASCEEDGSATYTATVEFEGETYTDVKTVELPATGHEFSEPVWTWADDLSAATATFKCAVCEKEFEVEATVERTVDDVVTYTATAEFEDETYTDVKELAYMARVFGNNMNLAERFTVNAMIDLNQIVLDDENAYALIYKEGVEEPQKVMISDTFTYQNNIRRFPADLVPAEFNDEFTLKLFDGSDKELVILAKDGTYLPNGFIFTAQEYLERGLVNESISQGWKETFKALSDLGRYAQLQFNHNTEKKADVKVAEEVLNSVTLDTLTPYRSSSTSAEGTTANFAGMTMVLNTGFILRAYFNLGDEKLEELTFKLDGEEVQATKSGSYYYLATENLPANKLGEAHTFTILKGEDTLVSASASAYSYAYSVISSGYTDNLLDLVRALYLYGEAAKVVLS